MKGSPGEKIVKSTCRMCHGVCGVLVHLRDDRVVKVTDTWPLGQI